MSWSASNITSGDYGIAISGTNAVCGNTSSASVNYSSNAGQTWLSSAVAAALNAFALDGLNGVGVQLNVTSAPAYYTTNGGSGFSQSATVFTGQHRSLAMSGNNAILGRSAGLYYSTNAGVTWTVSNRATSIFVTVAMANSSNAIAGSTNSVGIFYTTNGGQTWTQSSQTTGAFTQVAISGTTAIASMSSGGIYYSTDSGATWTQSNLTSGTYTQLAINSSGQAIAASRTTATGIYYSTNGGQTWTLSDAAVDSYVLYMNSSGGGALAGASQTATGTGMYYSTNGGQNWTLSDYTSQRFNSTLLTGNNAIASVFGGGLAYSTGPLCFHHDTLVLCEGGIHRPIHELSVGDRVLTHHHGFVPIKHIASSQLINGLYSKPSAFLYRHRAIPELMLSGEHRLLVKPDAFPEEARAKQLRHYGLDANLPENQVDGLLMWMACLHPDFERVEEPGTYSMYHLVLEHNDEPMRHYGIFVTEQNLVAETCHEADFHKMDKCSHLK